jgi:hypothetical protein
VILHAVPFLVKPFFVTGHELFYLNGIAHNKQRQLLDTNIKKVLRFFFARTFHVH